MKNGLGGVQSVLVLGGGSDIALATVERLVDARTRTVVLAARRPDELSDQCEALHKRGATLADAVAFDAAALSTHPAFIDDVWTRYGDFDAVILAFGLLGERDVIERDSAIQIVETNFTGAVSVLVPISERMKTQGHGTIVVLSSVAAERARTSNFIYGSAKAGLDAFSQGLGDSLMGSGVNVLVVRPGFVHTKMTEGLDPAPLSTTPDAVAEVIVKAIASGREMVWAPGPVRVLMSVLRHLPRPIFRQLPM